MCVMGIETHPIIAWTSLPYCTVLSTKMLSKIKWTIQGANEQMNITLHYHMQICQDKRELCLQKLRNLKIILTSLWSFSRIPHGKIHLNVNNRKLVVYRNKFSIHYQYRKLFCPIKRSKLDNGYQAALGMDYQQVVIGIT